MRVFFGKLFFVFFILFNITNYCYAQEQEEYFSDDEEVIFEPNSEVVIFGHYEQDNNESNGKEPIRWLVSKVEQDKVLLLSEYCLDYKEYNNEPYLITWPNCSHRKWLNTDFIKEAFDKKELSFILNSDLPECSDIEEDEFDDEYSIKFEDKLFLLSYDELNELFSDEKSKKAKVTDYVRAKGALATNSGYSKYCLRIRKRTDGLASVIKEDGRQSTTYGSRGDKGEFFSIRPALWLRKDYYNRIKTKEPSIVNEISEDVIQKSDGNWSLIGSSILLGKYKSEFSGKDKEKPIEWICVKSEKSRVLLLSKHILYYKSFDEDEDKDKNSEYSHCWAYCSLRKWLNNDFLEQTFNSSEESMIIKTSISTPDNREYNTSGGPITEDKIFLLSTEEIESVFKNIEEMKAKDIDNNRLSSGYYWLRSSGGSSFSASMAGKDGVSDNGSYVTSFGGVRPAFWVASSDYEKLRIDSIGKDGAGQLAGCVIKFGRYEQDNNLSNGKEPIEWVCLRQEGTKVLLISKYCLFEKPYNNERVLVSWEDCSLRKWLNTEFIEESFSPEEREKILLTHNNSYVRNSYTRNSYTDDKVFIFENNEVRNFNNYFIKEQIYTPYALSARLDKSKHNFPSSSLFWLRSHVAHEKIKFLDRGMVHSRESFVDSKKGILPVLWMQLDDLTNLEIE